MPATNGYVAKGALFDKLKAAADPGGGGLLDVLVAANPEWGNRCNVAYAMDGEMGSLAIYGGGFSFTQDDAVAETPGVLVGETVTQLVYIRAQTRIGVTGTIRDVQWLDDIIRQVANTMVKVIKQSPVLLNGVAVIGSRGGSGDYSTNDDEKVSLMSYQFTVASLFGWDQ